mmetsp:Transcript_76869/g.194135  ORF Transcript_76869/g.194135 Transcript_76869/m.194135 type:complete len:105 (+) Transcript_76869:228-542(+)
MSAQRQRNKRLKCSLGLLMLPPLANLGRMLGERLIARRILRWDTHILFLDLPVSGDRSRRFVHKCTFISSHVQLGIWMVPPGQESRLPSKGTRLNGLGKAILPK